MEFFRITHAAVGHHGLGAGAESGFGPEILCGVSFYPARLFIVVKKGRLHRHQKSSLQFHPALCQRMLNGLILTNGAVKHHAFICVLCGTLECILTDAHRLDAY